MSSLLTVADIIEKTRAGRSTIYEWAETGLIPSFKINGLLRFDPDKIEAWLRACKESAPEYNTPGAGRRPRKGGGKNGSLSTKG